MRELRTAFSTVEVMLASSMQNCDEMLRMASSPCAKERHRRVHHSAGGDRCDPRKTSARRGGSDDRGRLRPKASSNTGSVRPRGGATSAVDIPFGIRREGDASNGEATTSGGCGADDVERADGRSVRDEARHREHGTAQAERPVGSGTQDATKPGCTVQLAELDATHSKEKPRMERVRRRRKHKKDKNEAKAGVPPGGTSMSVAFVANNGNVGEADAVESAGSVADSRKRRPEPSAVVGGPPSTRTRTSTEESRKNKEKKHKKDKKEGKQRKEVNEAKPDKRQRRKATEAGGAVASGVSTTKPSGGAEDRADDILGQWLQSVVVHKPDQVEELAAEVRQAAAASAAVCAKAKRRPHEAVDTVSREEKKTAPTAKHDKVRAAAAAATVAKAAPHGARLPPRILTAAKSSPPLQLPVGVASERATAAGASATSEAAKLHANKRAAEARRTATPGDPAKACVPPPVVAPAASFAMSRIVAAPAAPANVAIAAPPSANAVARPPVDVSLVANNVAAKAFLAVAKEAKTKESASAVAARLLAALPNLGVEEEDLEETSSWTSSCSEGEADAATVQRQLPQLPQLPPLPLQGTPFFSRDDSPERKSAPHDDVAATAAVTGTDASTVSSAGVNASSAPSVESVKVAVDETKRWRTRRQLPDEAAPIAALTPPPTGTAATASAGGVPAAQRTLTGAKELDSKLSGLSGAISRSDSSSPSYPVIPVASHAGNAASGAAVAGQGVPEDTASSGVPTPPASRGVVDKAVTGRALPSVPAPVVTGVSKENAAKAVTGRALPSVPAPALTGVSKENAAKAEVRHAWNLLGMKSLKVVEATPPSAAAVAASAAARLPAPRHASGQAVGAGPKAAPLRRVGADSSSSSSDSSSSASRARVKGLAPTPQALGVNGTATVGRRVGSSSDSGSSSSSSGDSDRELAHRARTQANQRQRLGEPGVRSKPNTVSTGVAVSRQGGVTLAAAPPRGNGKAETKLVAPVSPGSDSSDSEARPVIANPRKGKVCAKMLARSYFRCICHYAPLSACSNELHRRRFQRI
eukprot:TRINITY_DN5568_c0_g1_i3.p1 TRINITY_DN5568_c0_g1~~TRINITY_DN5568_c0_g1_i3.p1  ORF type:complete len:1043 (-),score=203.98 TRINITY_DN5568_c0_g1_i3:125-3253(-)